MSEQTYEERAFNAENECERLRQDLAAARALLTELLNEDALQMHWHRRIDAALAGERKP